MRRFLQGVLLIVGLWATIEWWKNPMGHRGGSRLGEEDFSELCPEFLEPEDIEAHEEAVREQARRN